VAPIVGSHTNEEGEEMKKKRLWLILVVVLAVAMSISAPAMGGPDCDNDKFADHPLCGNGENPSDDVPIGGTMCDPNQYPPGIDGVQYDDFEFTLSGRWADTCIDVVSGAGPWTASIIDGSGAQSLGIVGRDSIAPGDACHGQTMKRDEIYGGLVEFGMPAATINACGDGYAEWVSVETDGLDEENHCVAFDDANRCLVTDMVDVTHPLVFHAFMRGSADASVTIHVDITPLP
jgi:hypothetical protein